MTESDSRSGLVQSVQRATHLLDLLADAGGRCGLSDLAQHTGLPLPTIHRLIRTLLEQGYVRQLANRQYALGPRLIRLGESAGRQLGADARPHLAQLAGDLGETANLAMLDREMVVYVAQAESRQSMRMFTEVGRRAHLHCTGVGKSVLAQLDDDTVQRIISISGMPPATDHTITDLDELLAELAQIRDRGYAVDDGEQEVGVRCFAVPVAGTPTPTAVSISGPDSRVTDEFGMRAVPLLRAAAADISSRGLHGIRSYAAVVRKST